MAKKLYWSISKQEYLPWDKYKKIAVPTYIKKECKKIDKCIKKRIERIMHKTPIRKRKLTLYS